MKQAMRVAIYINDEDRIETLLIEARSNIEYTKFGATHL